MRIAILGCGPAGLLAARAAEDVGYQPHIFSKVIKSNMAGAMHIHESIPGLLPEEPEGHVIYAKQGTREGYATKVYGSPDAPCSWDDFPEGAREAWSMENLYERLWADYGERISPALVSPEVVSVLSNKYDKIISAVPAPLLCSRGHDFPAAEVFIDRFPTVDFASNNVIIWSGDPKTAWYRYSRIFGSVSLEYAERRLGIAAGKKPIDTDCDCFAEVTRVGRFGRWKKGVLVHHAYQEARDALLEL